MTANEIAKQLENINWVQGDGKVKPFQHYADFIRQQEAALLAEQEHNEMLMVEIEALKKELALQKLSDIGQEIENEPVAHRFKWEEKMSWQYGDGYDATGAPNDPDYFAYEPLYTHPDEDRDSAIYATGYWKGIEYKKLRELTDEEIDEVWAETCSDFKLIENGKTRGIINIYDVSRAILKKASEK